MTTWDIIPSDRLRRLACRILFAALAGADGSLAAAPTADPSAARSATAGISLEEAERLAEDGSFELRALRIESAIGRETIRERTRAFFPAVSVSYRQNRTIAQRDFDNGDYSVQLNVSQPVYDGGRSSLALEAARISAGLAGRRLAEGREALRLKVRETYFAVLQSRIRVSIAKYSLKTAEYFFRIGRVEERQGSLTHLELRERAGELEQRRLALRRESDALRDRLTDFAVILQLPPGEKVAPRELDLFRLRLSAELPPYDDLLRQAEQNHPKLRQFRMELAQKQRQYLIAKYDYLPSIAVTGRYGRTGDTWPPRTTEWGVGVSLTFRLWGSTLTNDAVSNRTEGDVSRGLSAGGRLDLYDNPGFRREQLTATADLLRARRALADLRRTLRHDVERVLRELRLKRDELRLADENLAVRELRHRIDLDRMRLGELRYRDFLEEEQRLIEARYQLAAARTEAVVTVNKLEASLGLPLDALRIVNWAEIRQPKEGEDTRRNWQPRTEIRPPPKSEPPAPEPREPTRPTT